MGYLRSEGLYQILTLLELRLLKQLIKTEITGKNYMFVKY